MFAQLSSLLALATINLAAFAIGGPVVRAVGVAEDDRLSVGVWSLVVGFILGGVALAGLGLVGGLYPSVIGVVTLTICFAALSRFSRRDQRGPEEQSADGSRSTTAEKADACCLPPSAGLLRGWLVLAALVCLGAMVSALAPPTAGDALCYHLQLPKTFLAQHRLVYLPYDDNCTYPLLSEMWYFWALAMDTEVCAQLIHWEMGLLLGLATVILATPILGRPWAWVAGAATLLIPAVNNQMTAPLNDLSLAMFATLALAAWWHAVVDDENRRWYLLLGLAAGGALGTKYVAVAAAALVPVWLWNFAAQADRRRAMLRGTVVAGLVAIAVAGVWYARAAWYRGNPVFPLLADAGPGSEGLQTLPAAKSPLGRAPMQLVTSPWQVTMFPERFGGRAHQLGVVLLASLPGLALVRRLRGLGTLLAVAGGYWVLWFLLRQNVRFLLPIVPPLIVAAVWVWIELRRFPPLPRLMAGAVLALMLIAMALVPLARCRDQLDAAVGVETREHYLLRREPTYSAVALANLLLPPDAHILSQEHRTFYFRQPVTRESIYRRKTRYDLVTDPLDFSRQLRDEGFTHLLLAEMLSGPGVPYDPTLARLADSALSADPKTLTLVGDYRFDDPDGSLRRYRLVVLGRHP